MENKNNRVIQGSEKLKLQVTRMKKIRSNIKSGDVATGNYSVRKPWGLGY